MLDEAMARLGAHDRNALVLRYFQNKSLTEVGAAMGLEERTAQKRVSRALEKLRKFFGKRGVHSTAESIAETISTNSVQAAPAALAKIVTVAALAKGATASISTLTLIKGALKLMAWTNTKTAIIVGTALIVAAGTSVLMVKEVHAPKMIPSAITGFPQTPEELNAWYVEPPAGQNAATIELQGINAEQIAGVEKTPNLPILGNAPPPALSAPLSPAMKSALANFLQRNREALQFFGQGTQYEQSRYPVDLTMGSNTLLPYLFGIKKGMQMEEMAAILDAGNNDNQRAADDLLAAMGLARSLEAEPILISQLVRAAGVGLSMAALEEAVNRTTLSPESLGALSNAFQSMEAYDTKGEGFNRALVGEDVNHLALLKDRASLLQILNTPGNFGDDADQGRQMIAYLNRTPSLKGEQDYFETTFQQLMSARQDTFPGRTKDAEDVISQRVAEASSQGLLFNAWLWGGIQNVTAQEARCLANLRLAMTAIALEQYRSANGNQYPATLAALSPAYLAATPADPFDGKPLRYHKQGAGYILYSIGQNLKDNGGRQVGTGGNIPFSVISPPQY